MATRFYLPSTGAAAVSPAYAAEWEDTVNAASRLAMVRTRINSAFATITALETGSSTVNARDLLIRQYVSEPIPQAQTISGTLKGQLQMFESNSAANFLSQIIVRVVSGDGATVRGTLYAGDTRTTTPAGEELDILQNQRIPSAGVSPVTLSSVSAQNGDRIVVEIGVRANNVASTNYSTQARFGDNAGSDLGEGGTETTDLNPWIEFSQTIDFTVPPLTQDVGMVPIV